MLDCNDITQLQCGAEALREAIQEYVAARVRAIRARLRPEVSESVLIVKTWRCVKCQATGEIHSSNGEAMIDAIRAQHKRRRRLPDCTFDQTTVKVAPANQATAMASMA